MTVSTHREVERKFRVDEAFTIPALSAIPPLTQERTAAPVDMTAVYFDTDRLALLRWGATLRRREGGVDDGWHLKLPVEGLDARDEIRAPLGSGAAVPAALADIVARLVRGERLTPQATVRTRRTATLLLDANGEPIVEVVDDDVRVHDADGEIVDRFREIEVEIVDPHAAASHDTMDALAGVLVDAGAHPGSLSKAASALGARAQQPPDIPAFPPPATGALAADVIRAALGTHARRLLFADVAVRRDLPDAVHQMRVAARRLRSVLRTFDSLLDPEWSQALREELGWLASELGAIRDTEVLLERLDEDAELLGEPDAGQARAIIDPRLRSRLAAARSGALAALRSDRHEWLLDDLVAAADEPRVLDVAFVPIDEIGPALVGRAWRRFARAAAELRVDGPATTWHAARIRAKRARYSVDVLASIDGDRMAHLADELADVTEVLGEHQDAWVAQQVLRDLADAATGAEAFALGRLHDIEVEREALARLAFLEMWPQVKRAAKRSGLTRHGR